HHVACRRAAALPTERIVAEIRGMVGSRRHTVGVTYLETLTDNLVHAQDIAVPLGRRHDMPAEAAAVAANRVLALRSPPPPPFAPQVAGAPAPPPGPPLARPRRSRIPPPDERPPAGLRRTPRPPPAAVRRRRPSPHDPPHHTRPGMTSARSEKR